MIIERFMSLKVFYTFLIIIILTTSCVSTKRSGEKDYYQDVAEKVVRLVQNNKLTEAKTILREAMAKEKPEHAPFVRNKTLVYYATNSVQTMSAMLSATAFNLYRDNDSAKKNPGYNKELFDLYEKTPWDNSVAIRPSFPTLYFIMGSISITEKNYDLAIAYLDTATYMYEGFGIAWAEKMYAYTSMSNFKKAKEIGKYALTVNDIDFDKKGKAAILRKLGWIAVEENDLESGEKYYKESIENEDSKLARDELKYIKDMKK